MHIFDGLRVLELSGRIAGAACGKLFAGFGADVLRVAGGTTPVLDEDARAWFHTGKRETALDPSDPAQREAFEALICEADVVIDAWGYGVLDGAGFDAARLLAIRPSLVLCRITPYGQTGPRRTWEADDITLYAASGLMHATGDGARAPLNARPRICELTAGLNAYAACLMALMRRTRDGGGDAIDLSIHEASMENAEVAIEEFLSIGKVARRNGDQHAMVPWRTYPCADGHAAIVGGPIRHWLGAARMFGVPALREPRLGGMDGRIRHRAEFESLIAPYLAAHGKRELFHAGQKAGLAWAYLASLPEALEDPQTVARGFLVDLPNAAGETLRMPGAPFRSERMPWRNAPAPAPATREASVWKPRSQGLDEERAPPASADRPATLVGPGDANGDVRVLGNEPAPGPHDHAPLAGTLVLDFTHDWAGPHAARLLADYGAEVVKIEYPARLDGMRGGDVALIDERPRFWQLHRNKKSLTLDLARAPHRRVLDRLLARADVILENSRPGVMERKGCGYEHARSLKPDVVMVAMSAFGSTGPYAGYCGYGGTLEAISGLQSLTAYDAGSPWFRIREMDVMNGLMGACAAVGALWHARRTGQGQWIDLSEYETTLWFAGEHVPRAVRTRASPAPVGNRHPHHAPQGCYAAAGDDRWVALCVRSDAEWARLAARIGMSDAASADASGRRERHDEIDARIGAWLAARDPVAAVEELQSLGIAASMVASAADLAADPHLEVRGWFQSAGADRFPGLPFRFARGGGRIAARGPALGANNAEFFADAGESDALPRLGPDTIGTAYALG